MGSQVLHQPLHLQQMRNHLVKISKPQYSSFARPWPGCASWGRANPQDSTSWSPSWWQLWLPGRHIGVLVCDIKRSFVRHMFGFKSIYFSRTTSLDLDIWTMKKEYHETQMRTCVTIPPICERTTLSSTLAVSTFDNKVHIFIHFRLL